MRQQVQKTYATTPSVIERRWWVVDAKGMTLGRLASKVAPLLRGTHKPYFTPHLDTGDYVIIVNADKIHVTGKRMDQKTYYRHSGYPGGLKSLTLRELMARYPNPWAGKCSGSSKYTPAANTRIKRSSPNAWTHKATDHIDSRRSQSRNNARMTASQAL